jgi:hypothetical protein
LSCRDARRDAPPPSFRQVTQSRHPTANRSNRRRHPCQAVEAVSSQPLHHPKPSSPLCGLTEASPSLGVKSPSRRLGLPRSHRSALTVHRVHRRRRAHVPPSHRRRTRSSTVLATDVAGDALPSARVTQAPTSCLGPPCTAGPVWPWAAPAMCKRAAPSGVADRSTTVQVGC